MGLCWQMLLVSAVFVYSKFCWCITGSSRHLVSALIFTVYFKIVFSFVRGLSLLFGHSFWFQKEVCPSVLWITFCFCIGSNVWTLDLYKLLPMHGKCKVLHLMSYLSDSSISGTLFPHNQLWVELMYIIKIFLLTSFFPHSSVWCSMLLDLWGCVVFRFEEVFELQVTNARVRSWFFFCCFLKTFRLFATVKCIIH